MFTDKAQRIIDLAKDHVYGTAGPAGEISVLALLTAAVNQVEPALLLAECTTLSREKLRSACPALVVTSPCRSRLALGEPARALVLLARELSGIVADRAHPGLIDARHLVAAMSMSSDVCTTVGATPLRQDDAITRLATWYDHDLQGSHLDQLTDRLRALRGDLLRHVFGQDHAVHAFVEGLFSAEVVASVDTSRRAPRAVFVFAGPPGVGKTFMAELGAAHLQRPFKRFDMSGFGGIQQSDGLVGMARSFMGAHPGVLTEFVEKNPNAVLLFDEIEKAHRNTIHLFLQVLDAGTLEDKYHERNVSFTDTTVIFTTNAGRSLYERPNTTGIHAAHAGFHRQTILDALAHEQDPLTREPFFPSAICSRLATGHPVLLNHLGVHELERVASSELRRVGNLLERQYFKTFTFDPLTALCIVLREGARVDARTVRSEAESYVKGELFRFCQLFNTDRLERVLESVDAVHFQLDEETTGTPDGLEGMFRATDPARVVLVASEDLGRLYSTQVNGVAWCTADSPDRALDLLAERDADLLLLDIFLGRQPSTTSVQEFDHVPLGSRSLQQGQEFLRRIRERFPELPVFLLAVGRSERQAGKRAVDDEAFLAGVRAGGARGVIESAFVDETGRDWERARDDFQNRLLALALQTHRNRRAALLGQQRKVLMFDSVPRLEADRRKLTFFLRNLRLGRAVAASDVGEVLDDVERPVTRFADVLGAATAKEELQFFIDFLRTPSRYAALGLRPPKGVLLHGPPGTGKTMLARAMAGESNVAFIPVAATNFVTLWQGSGPQNLRDLFARARRYAPSIIFIDEIDTIGKLRVGSPGAGQAEEATLNALLAEMDGFAGSTSSRPVFVLAATNFRVDDDGDDRVSARRLDPALVRRFDRTIFVDLPDRDARARYLQMRLAGRSGATVSADTIERLASQSAGMSIANLEAVVEAAARAAAKGSGAMSDGILEDAFESIRHGDVKVWSPDLLERTARHEAGHTIMYWLSGWWPIYVTVVGRGHHGGYMERDSSEAARELRTRNELLAGIRVSLGGRGAELLYYGDEGGLSTGVRGDLEAATAQARAMVCAYGMDAEMGLIGLGDLLTHAEAMSSPAMSQVNDVVRRMLQDEMKRTTELLKANRGPLELIARALVERNRLTRKDLMDILPARPEPPGLQS